MQSIRNCFVIEIQFYWVLIIHLPHAGRLEHSILETVDKTTHYRQIFSRKKMFVNSYISYKGCIDGWWFNPDLNSCHWPFLNYICLQRLQIFHRISLLCMCGEINTKENLQMKIRPNNKRIIKCFLLSNISRSLGRIPSATKQSYRYAEY